MIPSCFDMNTSAMRTLYHNSPSRDLQEAPLRTRMNVSEEGRSTDQGMFSALYMLKGLIAGNEL